MIGYEHIKIPHFVSTYLSFKEYPEVSFRMLDYTEWSKPVNIAQLKNRVIELRQEQGWIASNSPDEERGEVETDTIRKWGKEGDLPYLHLNVFVRPRLNKLARTVYVNTQYVMVNTTSFVLLIRQKGSTNDFLTLRPKDKKPFRYSLFCLCVLP
jgi:hypothetical protein